VWQAGRAGRAGCSAVPNPPAARLRLSNPRLHCPCVHKHNMSHVRLATPLVCMPLGRYTAPSAHRVLPYTAGRLR
jgi:hypothetical protein